MVVQKKFNANETIYKFKAKLVTKWSSQNDEIEYEGTLVAVVKINTIRLNIVLSTKFNCVIPQMDVKSSFLNSDLKEEIHLVQPEGFVK